MTVFGFGLTLGGALSALVIWTLSGLTAWVPAWGAATTVLLAGAAVLAHETRLVTLHLPANHRQVPQEVFTAGPYRSALQFGFELGTGVRTYLPSAVPHLLAVALLVLHIPLAVALVTGISFGLGRTAMTISRTTSREPEGWDALLRVRLRIIRPAAALTAITACATIIW